VVERGETNKSDIRENIRGRTSKNGIYVLMNFSFGIQVGSFWVVFSTMWKRGKGKGGNNKHTIGRDGGEVPLCQCSFCTYGVNIHYGRNMYVDTSMK